jgi:hypothetical protein
MRERGKNKSRKTSGIMAIHANITASGHAGFMTKQSFGVCMFICLLGCNFEGGLYRKMTG